MQWQEDTTWEVLGSNSGVGKAGNHHVVVNVLYNIILINLLRESLKSIGMTRPTHLLAAQMRDATKKLIKRIIAWRHCLE